MKTVSVAEAVSLIPDGANLMVGGFVGVGVTVEQGAAATEAKLAIADTISEMRL